jgi:hypothetical protein
MVPPVLREEGYFGLERRRLKERPRPPRSGLVQRKADQWPRPRRRPFESQ